LQTEWLP